MSFSRRVPSLPVQKQTPNPNYDCTVHTTYFPFVFSNAKQMQRFLWVLIRIDSWADSFCFSPPPTSKCRYIQKTNKLPEINLIFGDSIHLCFFFIKLFEFVYDKKLNNECIFILIFYRKKARIKSPKISVFCYFAAFFESILN